LFFRILWDNSRFSLVILYCVIYIHVNELSWKKQSGSIDRNIIVKNNASDKLDKKKLIIKRILK